MLTDTVGFIRKLPHHLIEAFKSTLEEAKYSDIILHVVDCSNPNMDMQMHVVYETLRELKVEDKIIVTVFNKIDQKEDGEFPRDLHISPGPAQPSVRESLLTDEASSQRIRDFAFGDQGASPLEPDRQGAGAEYFRAGKGETPFPPDRGGSTVDRQAST